VEAGNGSAKKRTPFSARLPQATLREAARVAEALAALAAPATPAVIAQHMDISSSSGGFKTKLAAAGYYGLVQVDGERRTLTERGTEITSGDASRVEAASRDAVMSTTFGPILHSLRGRPVSEAIVSSRIQSDYNVPAASAEHLARVLVQSARDAALVTDDSFDAMAIEAHARVMPDAAPTPRGGKSAPVAPSPKPTAKPQAETPVPAAPRTRVETAEPPPFNQSLQIVVKIDATNLSPEQIAALVRALQAPPAPA
jgi:hypothetical protein